MFGFLCTLCESIQAWQIDLINMSTVQCPASSSSVNKSNSTSSSWTWGNDKKANVKCYRLQSSFFFLSSSSELIHIVSIILNPNFSAVFLFHHVGHKETSASATVLLTVKQVAVTLFQLVSHWMRSLNNAPRAVRTRSGLCSAGLRCCGSLTSTLGQGNNRETVVTRNSVDGVRRWAHLSLGSRG